MVTPISLQFQLRKPGIARKRYVLKPRVRKIEAIEGTKQKKEERETKRHPFKGINSAADGGATSCNERIFTIKFPSKMFRPEMHINPRRDSILIKASYR